MRAFPFSSVIACGLAAAVTILTLAGCQPAEEPETAEEEPAAEEATDMDDETAIRALADRYASSWAGGDAAAIANLFATDGDLVTVDGQAQEGRAEIQAALAADFEGMFNGTQISIENDSIRFLEPDVAIVDGSFEITGITGPDGAAAEPLSGLFTNIAIREGGEWKIRSLRPMVPQSAAAPESDD